MLARWATVFAGLMLLSYLPNDVWASCGGSVLWAPSVPAQAVDVVTPGEGSIGDSLVGSWWAFGFGDEALGLGDDNGSRDETVWLQIDRPGSEGKLIPVDDWFNSGVDGCIADRGLPPMVLMLNDRSTDGTSAYFGVVSVAFNQQNGVDYNLAYVEGGPVTGFDLVPIPTLTVDSLDVGTNAANVTVSWSQSDVESGVYKEAATTLAELIPSYGLYYFQGNSAPQYPAPLKVESTNKT